MTLTTTPGWDLEITALRQPAGIQLCGEIDVGTLPELELALELLADHPGDIVVDVRGLTFIDVSGARLLARTAMRLRPAGRCVRLRAVSPFVRQVLTLLGWAELFEFERF
jgi:anti-anti-sigma factor